MKISSASKKVLASALSAAMVVAFAPTVAFAANAGDQVKIKFITATDHNQIPGTSLAPDGQTNILLSDGQVKTAAISVAGTGFTYYGASIDGWIYDANNNGVVDDGEALIASSGATTIPSFVLSEDVKHGDTVQLIAHYATPAFGTVAYGGAAAVQGKLASDVKAGTAVFTLPTVNVTTGTYTLTIKKGDTVIFESDKLDGTKIAAAENDAIVVKTADPTNANTVAGKVADEVVYIDKYGAGTYTFTLTNSDGYEASTTATVYGVTLGNGGDASVIVDNGATEYTYLFAKGDTDNNKLGKIYDAIKLVKATDANGTKNGTDGAYKWETATAHAIESDGDSTKVTEDMELAPAFETTRIATIDFAGKKLSVATAHFAKVEGNAATAGVKGYNVKIDGPSGTVLNMDTAQTANEQTFPTTIDLTFVANATTGAKFELGTTAKLYTTAKPEAGTYTIAITQNKLDGTSKVYTKSVELVPVTYVLGEGTDWDTTADKNVVKTLPALVQPGKTIAAAYSEGNLDTDLADIKIADTTQVLDSWTVSGLKKDGKAVTTIKAGTDLAGYTVTGAVTMTAVYKVTKAAAPEVSVADKTVTISAAAGTTAQYRIGVAGSWTNYSAPFTLKVTDSQFQVRSYEGDKVSDIVTYTRYDVNTTDTTAYVPQTAVKTFATTLGQGKTADGKAYAANDATYKAAVAAADAKIKAISFADKTGWKNAVIEAKGDLYAAYAAVVKAGLGAYKTGVANTDGTVSVISDTAYNSAVATIDNVVAAWALNNDKDKANDVAVNGKSANIGEGDYSAAIYAAAEGAVKGAIKYAKADVDAAAAVTTQLKAAKTVAEAEAALKAYEALTATQKELVAAADVTAAEAIVAAAAVKDAQDDAAVSKARSTSKTVKAGKNGKTTKTQSITLKKITSKSGAKVTYKKITKGSSKYITVKSGKAYLKKGVKKGSYKAYVSAKCGTQTAKIKVTFKVK